MCFKIQLKTYECFLIVGADLTFIYHILKLPEICKRAYKYYCIIHWSGGTPILITTMIYL